MIQINPSILAEPWVLFWRQTFTDRCNQAIHAQKEILPQSQGWASLTLVHLVALFSETSSLKKKKQLTVPYPWTSPNYLSRGWQQHWEPLVFTPRLLGGSIIIPNLGKGQLRSKVSSQEPSGDRPRGDLTTTQASCLHVPGFFLTTPCYCWSQWKYQYFSGCRAEEINLSHHTTDKF